MSRISRRSILAALGVGLTTGGCLGNPGGDPEESTRTTSPSSTETTTFGDRTTREGGTTTKDDETTTEAAETTTDDWIARASKSPDPDHEISLRNDAEETRTIRVRVVRERTGETVFEATRDVSPGSEVVAYNLRETDPEGVESFQICAELVGATAGPTRTTTETRTTAETRTTTETRTTADSSGSAGDDSPYRDCVTIDTNECYGNAHASVFEDGTLGIVYAIC